MSQSLQPPDVKKEWSGKDVLQTAQGEGKIGCSTFSKDSDFQLRGMTSTWNKGLDREIEWLLLDGKRGWLNAISQACLCSLADNFYLAIIV